MNVQQWLADLLASGPVPAKSVRAQAEADWIGWRTIKRHKARLGVRCVQRRHPEQGRCWWWMLKMAP